MKCKLCPRNCNVDRDKGELGFCGAPGKMVIARYSLHQWEEPCISGVKGSGMIFFSYCNMRCCFCQNYEISTLHKGRVVNIEEFCNICLELQENGASNINLVTPTMYVPYIVDGLILAKKRGLTIPIVYNTSGYENVATIRRLKGLVDIYLPDFKYYDEEKARRYSKCDNYFEYASLAIKEMVKQIGKIEIGKDGLMKKGVIIRHLLLPKGLEDSKKIIRYLYDTYHDDIVLSIMNQYTPVRETEYEELGKKVEEASYDELVNYAYDLGVRSAFVQEKGTQDESFIPDFDVFRAI